MWIFPIPMREITHTPNKLNSSQIIPEPLNYIHINPENGRKISMVTPCLFVGGQPGPNNSKRRFTEPFPRFHQFDIIYFIYFARSHRNMVIPACVGGRQRRSTPICANSLLMRFRPAGIVYGGCGLRYDHEATPPIEHIPLIHRR